MNNIKKKFLNLYTNLSMYKEMQRRIKAGTLASMLGFGLTSFNLPNQNDILPNPDTTISENLEEQTLITENILDLLRNSSNNDENISTLANQIIDCYNMDDYLKKDAFNLLCSMLSKGCFSSYDVGFETANEKSFMKGIGSYDESGSNKLISTNYYYGIDSISFYAGIKNHQNPENPNDSISLGFNIWKSNFDNILSTDVSLVYSLAEDRLNFIKSEMYVTYVQKTNTLAFRVYEYYYDGTYDLKDEQTFTISSEIEQKIGETIVTCYNDNLSYEDALSKLMNVIAKKR